MGSGRGFFCTHCNYKVAARWGKGFRYPLVYQETIQGMKEGRYGNVAKAFLDEHPDGAVNAEKTLAKCEKCGKYDNVQDLTMFIPKEGYIHKVNPDQIWSTSAHFKDFDYVNSFDLESHYTEFKKYPHKCKYCGGAMVIIPFYSYKINPKGRGVDEISKQIASTIKEIDCPICGEKMIALEFIDWD